MAGRHVARERRKNNDGGRLALPKSVDSTTRYAHVCSAHCVLEITTADSSGSISI